MSIARLALAIAFLAFLESGAVGAEPEDPAAESNWLDEETWPELVAARYLDVGEGDDDVSKLLKERYNSGKMELRSRYVYWLQDAESLPQVYDAVRRVVEARLEAGGPRSDPVTILKEKLAFAEVVKKQAEGLRKKYNRARQISDVDCAAYFRSCAEIELLRVQGDLKEDPCRVTAESGVQPNGNDPSATKIQQLLRQRHDVLEQRYDAVKSRRHDGTLHYEYVVPALDDLLKAKLKLASSKQERVDIYRQRIDNLRRLEEIAKVRVKDGRTLVDTSLLATADRIQAEIECLCEESKAE